MTRDELAAIIDAHIEVYATRLKLEAWGINVDLEEDEAKFQSEKQHETASAWMYCEPPYRQALITFCVPRVLHREGALRLLRHELLHLLHADLNGFRDMAHLFARTGRETGALNAAWHDGIERFNWQLEQMLDANGWQWEIGDP